MYINIMLDFAVGLVPFVGDVADALFRANTRNAVVLEKHLRAKGAKALKAQGQATLAVDPTDPDEYDRQLREERGPPPPYTGPSTASGARGAEGEAQGQTQSTQDQVPQSKRSGWFSGFGGKKKQPDVERGHDLPNATT